MSFVNAFLAKKSVMFYTCMRSLMTRVILSFAVVTFQDTASISI